MPEKNTSTTAALLASLELILHEIMTMENAIRESKTITDADRRQLRHELTHLRERADGLMTWLTEARLESTKH